MLSIDVVNGGKQHDIIRKFQKSDVISGGKQNDIILKFQKSDAVNRCCQWRKVKRQWPYILCTDFLCNLYFDDIVFFVCMFIRAPCALLARIKSTFVARCLSHTCHWARRKEIRAGYSAWISISGLRSEEAEERGGEERGGRRRTTRRKRRTQAAHVHVRPRQLAFV